MLVYAKNPKGVIKIHQYRIYGRAMGYDPCNIPFDLYLQCRDALETATYREGILSKMFGKPFPEIAFKYDELRFLPHATLDKIGKLIVPNYRKRWTLKKKVTNIQSVIKAA